MEPAFELIDRTNPEDLHIIFKRMRPKNHKVWLAIYGIILVLSIPVSWYTDNYKVLLYGLICGGYGIWLYFAPGRNAKKRYEMMLRSHYGKIPPCRVCFGQTITMEEEDNRSVLPYEKISMIEVEKGRIIICRQNGAGWYIFSLNEFIRGDLPGLCRFLREKCPNVRLVGFPDM